MSCVRVIFSVPTLAALWYKVIFVVITLDGMWYIFLDMMVPTFCSGWNIVFLGGSSSKWRVVHSHWYVSSPDDVWYIDGVVIWSQP